MSSVNLEPSLVLLNGGMAAEESDNDAPRRRGRPRTNSSDLAQQLLDDVDQLDDSGISPRTNTLTRRIEYCDPITGEEKTFGGNDNLILPVKLAAATGNTLNEGRFRQAFNYISERDSYAPHQEFLLQCSEEAEPCPFFDHLGKRYFNTDSEFLNRMLRKFFIGCVARAFEPGCSFSWMLVLCARQGVGKSAWVRNLVPHGLFAEITASLDTLNKETYRLHTAWLLELPELEQFFASKQHEILKNLISVRFDEVRLPYQLPTQMPRGFGMVGTANSKDILVDCTGNRRFVPIDVGSFQIPWRALEEERAGIWSAALNAYRAGEPWELSPQELAELREYQSDFELRDPWHDIITTATMGKDELRMEHLLTTVLSIPTERQHSGHRKRVGGILRSLDFESTTRKVEGKSTRIWKRRAMHVSEFSKTDF